MNTFIRWWKFNLVGALGMVLQLATLTALNGFLRGHYLIASTLAVEIAVIHNFFWHTRYTWRDRSYPWRDRNNNSHERSNAWQHKRNTTARQFLRFQCANGLTSLLNNLILMRLLVHHAHLPVLLANTIAILSGSLLNFTLSHQWAFTQTQTTEAV